MRLTKHDYTEAHPHRRRKPTRRELAMKLFREIRRQMIASGEVPNPATAPPKYEFRWSVGSVTAGKIRANTTGEARARVKALLGLGSSRRLPQSVKIERLPNENPSECVGTTEGSPVQE